MHNYLHMYVILSGGSDAGSLGVLLRPPRPVNLRISEEATQNADIHVVATGVPVRGIRGPLPFALYSSLLPDLLRLPNVLRSLSDYASLHQPWVVSVSLS